MDFVEGALERVRHSKTARGLPCDLAAGRLVALAEALAARKDERRRPQLRQTAHSTSRLGDERSEDVSRVREVRFRHRTVDRELVAHRGSCLVGERGAPDVEQQAGIEGVGDLAFGHAQLAGKGGADQARAHRCLLRQPEAEIGHDREPAEYVRKTEPRAHGAIVSRSPSVCQAVDPLGVAPCARHDSNMRPLPPQREYLERTHTETEEIA
jgi:hypothetical protein